MPSANTEQEHNLFDGKPVSALQMMVFSVCFLMNALDGMDVLVVSYAAPLLASDWSIPPETLGLIFSAGLVGMTIGAMFIAPAADRIGRRRMILGAVILTGIGVTATAAAESLTALLTLRLISGLGIGAMLASVATMTAEFAPDRRRNLIMGIVLAGYPIGASLFGFAAADLLPVYGWRASFLTAGIITLATVPLVLVALPESPTFLLRVRPTGALERLNNILRRLEIEPFKKLPAIEAATPASGVSHLFLAGLGRETIILWLAFFMNFAALYFLLSWIPKLASSAGLPLEMAIYAGTVFNVGSVIGIASCGLLSQWLGLKRTIALFLLVTAVLMGLFGFAAGSLLVLVLFGLIGFFMQGGFIGLYMIATRMYSTEIRTTGVGWAIGAGRTGAIAGPLVGGLLVGLGMAIGTNFRWFALTLILAAGLTLLLRSPRID
ncbi:MAG: MFS transporter [Pseudomonadota bacterium]